MNSVDPRRQTVLEFFFKDPVVYHWNQLAEMFSTMADLWDHAEPSIFFKAALRDGVLTGNVRYHFAVECLKRIRDLHVKIDTEYDAILSALIDGEVEWQSLCDRSILLERKHGYHTATVALVAATHGNYSNLLACAGRLAVEEHVQKLAKADEYKYGPAHSEHYAGQWRAESARVSESLASWLRENVLNPFKKP